ncbi:FRAS1-related extracellular matrix protein 1a isoform X2 [Hemiscyllium ocellatum]|uniref:FRAS1-related extracellular matrix protein 1a isoform X2 n=1 Tax=Hemiscyllium ocellatum TaxID=170820 RepID=UPI0029662F36|nr:FRAS1-related extracellular matrix protein 1a isoform X2 [Hemiscyllium ocellatum]
MKHYWERPAILMYLCLWRCIAPSFIQVNLGLSVPKGQSAFLSKEDLQFNVPKEKDSCKVEVVVNEPITQRVGKLTPQVFDCHFLANEVKYTHNGCPILDEDQVMLRLYRFTETETFTETFILKVHLLDSDCNIIQLGSTSLEVPEFYGFSNIIDRNVLTFVYDVAMNLDCTVHITTQDTLLPAYGQLVMGKPPEGPARGDQPNSFLQIMKKSSKEKSSQDNLKEVHALKVNCEEFLVLGLHYQHLRPPSPDVDYITISLELVDSRSKNVHKKENAWIPVRIRNAFPNLPPKASFIAMYILEVDQFILTPITTQTLDGEDSESPKTQLVFNVTKPPLQGFITHLSDHTKPITSFTWTDLNEMLIAFQPPNNSHTERRNYEVEFEVHDFYFRNSAPIMVHISIRTTDTNAPRVSWNMGLDLLEGQSRTITWEQFQVVDNDALSAVRLITVDGLLHGRLTVRGGKGFMFTVDDIKSGVVHYHHDDSDSTNDFIVFRIFDGNHSTRHKFPINILPKDDSPPFLINNVILELYEDQEIQIEKVMLQASDMDSSDDYILFKIIKPPQAGEILKRTAPELSGYPITRFQQSDLFNARIYYRHLGGEVFEDSFEFILSDSHEPPNLSDPQTVIIHITPVDDQLPKEAPWALRHLVVKETEIAHLTKNQLYFTDTEIPDGEIVYAITAGPFFTSVLGLTDTGKLFLTDSMKKLTKKSNVPMLRSFTQHAVNYLKVAYMPPIQDIGPDPQHLQFLFSVSNQHGGTLIGLCFNITVLPVDNQAPEILTKQLDVEEGGVGQITVDHILVMDVDTKDHQIKIVLQKQPIHGVVKVDGDPMIEGDIFNLEDLGQLKISYNHDDSETRRDEVTFSATDGSNSAECVLQIQILPVNDEPPMMKPGLKPMMHCLEGAEVAITAENLYATDLDSDDERLMFMIARQPFHGVVQKDSQIIDHFSQADILSGSVTYIHTGGEVGLTPCFDTITFVISDWDGGTVEGCCSEEPFSPLLSIHNSLPVYDLNITIMPINNQPPTIIIGETFIVDEGLSAAITAGHLCASDLDTANDELTFVLWSSPQFGYIENTLPSPGYEKSNVGISIDSFDMKHIKDFHINYVQFHHQQIEPTADQFMLYVTDGQHQSAAVPFYIIIKPTNDEPPSFLARNITVSEGQVRELDPSIINVADLDLPTDSLVFIIKQQPNHGKIVNGNDIIQYKHQIHSHEEHLVHDFTMDQLKHGMKLMYKHDDSETKTDSFTIQLSDGKHAVNKVIQVTILPVNDEKPLLSRNNELEVEIGDSRIISSVVLEAEDKDTSRQHVYYVMDSVPKQGVLQIKEGRDWIPLHPGMNCSQDDIDMNRLRYIHTGAIGSNGRDSFHFHLSDGDHRSSVHRFQIFIQNIEKGEITIFLKPLTIFKGERGILTTAVLLASDGSNKPEELLYVITMPPSYGQVEYITYPGVAITSFSQMDVAAQAVSYTHKSTVTASSDSLRFIVSNGLSTRNGSLEIIIENIDRILPTLLNNKGIRLVEGSMVSISPDVLQLSDPDTPPQNLTYIIAQQPQHGQLHLKGAVLKQHNFTQLDVDSMDIAYKHDGGDSQIDRFTFVVTDMTNHGFLVNGVLHTEPSVFTIQVDHKDKAFPRIVYLQCPSQVEVFKNQKYGIYISSRHLKASDRDSKDEELIYHILRGFIWNKFTQKDLNSRNIIYIISASSAVMSDSLEFQVSDSSGNSALPQILDLKWSRIEMMESEYRVCEDVGLFSVKVLRTGYFMDSAFVGIKVNSISALVGKDFTHSSANLIQFDPGVSVKSWNIVITNDKLEENEETFEVLLTSPINAVLGAKAKILIKIIDGEKDRCNLAFMNDRNEENPPGRVLRERLASGSSTFPNLKSNSSLEEGMAMTNLHEDLKRSQGDVMQQLPLKPPSKKKLMYHGVIALKVEGDRSPSVYNRRATVVITSQSQQHFLGKTELSQIDKVTTVPASQQIPVQQEPSSKICPSGWTYHDYRCYYLNTKHKATWIGAARACKEMYHGNLVSVISKQDMEWLWDFSGRRSFWIGLNDRISPGKWNWAGGEHVSFTNWKRGLPPTSRKKGKNCVLVRRRGKWEVKNCKQGKPHYYMCSVH